jgi:hypothetical protein
LRWTSQKGARYLLEVDGMVIASAQARGESTEPALALALEPRSSRAATLAAARRLAKSLDRVALSHDVKVLKEVAPP